MSHVNKYEPQVSKIEPSKTYTEKSIYLKNSKGGGKSLTKGNNNRRIILQGKSNEVVRRELEWIRLGERSKTKKQKSHHSLLSHTFYHCVVENDKKVSIRIMNTKANLLESYSSDYNQIQYI